MPFSPPLIKPPIPPPKAPPVPPFRLPPIREPPTQTDPQIDIPNKPPTENDLLGVVCIYSNPPIYTPKKIRYKYPNSDWVEVEGDRFTIENQEDVIIADYRPRAITVVTVRIRPGFQNAGSLQDYASWVEINVQAQRSDFFRGIYVSWEWDQPFTTNGNATWQNFGIKINYLNSNNVLEFIRLQSTLSLFSVALFFADGVSRRLDILQLNPSNSSVIIEGQCIFTIFDANDQVILAETNSVCPEVEVIPEKCEYRQENEKLVRKAVVGIFQTLRIEYEDNCAKVLLDSPPLPFSTEIYQECSDENCSSPPKIRFDKKCEETCEQCPPGTVVKVLQGSSIACVDANGCILKRIEFKPGCNTYDCVCD